MAYGFEWKTAEDLIANIHTVCEFEGWGEETTLAELTGTEDPEEYRKAHELWLKLKEVFNVEAKAYDPEIYDSRLGSIGEVKRREVLRNAWWDMLNGNSYGDYETLTTIIEVLHHGEMLETGKILFGS